MSEEAETDKPTTTKEPCPREGEDENEDSQISLKSGSKEDEAAEGATEFVPNVYTFILKDVFGNNVYLPTSELSNIRVSSPPFYLLLDHTIAVLWNLYSGKNTDTLRSSHLHWVLAFLDGLKDRQNRHTADVTLIMEHIQTMLVNLYSQIDGDELEKRNNDKITEYSRLNAKGNRTFEEFETSLKADALRQATLNESTAEEPAGEEADATAADMEADMEMNNIACTSLTLRDMLEKHPEKLHELLHNPEESSAEAAAYLKPKETKAEIPPSVIEWRDEQYSKLIAQINSLKDFDEALQGANCSPDVIEKLQRYVEEKKQ